MEMLRAHHTAKIVSLDDLITRIGPRPRAQTVVMCHGVFDVVHPGHLRHLLYASSRADLLVCGVTADRYISTSKGPYRPHVPQELRAANLAMLDIINYVVVVDEEKPLELIKRLQPDYYAKGFEYSSTARGREIAELGAVEAYGGEVLFTPGDVVYSSSTLIEEAAPDLRYDKLHLMMQRAGVVFDDLRRTVEGMRGRRVHVMGDAIVDRLTYCEMIGANAKTPTVSVRRDRHFDFVGGAAVVAKHAKAAGAEVQLTTVVGDDTAGLLVLKDLEAVGVDVFPIVDRARPTTLKEAVVVDGYRMLKIDTVDNRSVSDALLSRLCEQLRDTPAGAAVVFSDFRHGIFNSRTIRVLTSAIPSGMLRAADSQVASRWGNVTDFVGFDLITPNEREARFALADQDSVVRALAHRLYEQAGCRWLLVKLGARGVLGFAGELDSFVLDSFAEEVRDPVGAGDAFLAYATLALLVRPCLVTAAVLGSFAAAVECGYDGNVPVAPERVLAKVDEAEGELR